MESRMLPCNESDPNLSVAQTCAVLTPISPLTRICMWQRWLFAKLSDLQHQLPMSLTGPHFDMYSFISAL